MEIVGYTVHFGSSLTSFHHDRAAAEQWAAKCRGFVRPAYELTDEEIRLLHEHAPADPAP
jgi:hypothetical protein